MKRYLLLAICPFIVIGCTPPSIVLQPPIKIQSNDDDRRYRRDRRDYDDRYYRGDENRGYNRKGFCPPGQAKKGNC